MQDEELLAGGGGGVNSVAADLPHGVRHALQHGESVIRAPLSAAITESVLMDLAMFREQLILLSQSK